MFAAIDRNSGLSVKKQLYDAITSKILQGELSEGEKLPSSREFANQLGIARNTVIEIYEQLVSEGYIKAENGKGTFVCRVLTVPADKRTVKQREKRVPAVKDNRILFAGGVPDLGAFPGKAWMRAMKRSFDEVQEDDLGYMNASGYRPLRDSLARYLFQCKGINCSGRQIVIVNGTSDAVALLALMFQQRFSQVIAEAATVSFVPDIFRAYSYSLYPVAVDESGICTGQLPDMDNCLIFISPSHQYPLGGTLPVDRRHQLLEYAKEHRHYIIEDDYDSEFRYSGAPVNSLHQLAPDYVIHVGTFSKTLAPFLRLAYMVMPEQLVAQTRKLLKKLNHRVNTMNQAALEYLLKQGIYVKHVHSMCKQYKKKMQCLIRVLNEQFGENIRINGMNSGLHIAVVFPGREFNRESTAVFSQHGLGIELLTDYMLEKADTCNTLILGFGNLSEKEILEGICRLKEAIDAL